MPSARGMTRHAFRIALNTAMRALMVMADGHLGMVRPSYKTSTITIAARARMATMMLRTSHSQNCCTGPFPEDDFLRLPPSFCPS